MLSTEQIRYISKAVATGIVEAITELSRLQDEREEITQPTPQVVAEPAVQKECTSNETPQVTYEQVRAVTIAVAKISKDKAVAGLARFGAKNAKELKEDQWAPYINYMCEVMDNGIESSHE